MNRAVREQSVTQIRTESREDAEAIGHVHTRAFGRPVEAELVSKLRQSCHELLSLVAIRQGQIVGHVLFSPARLESGNRVIHGMGLAPVAVLPEHQRQGIGSALIIEEIERLRRGGCPFIIVLGEPAYYPRFGFVRASRYGIRCQWEGVPDEAFIILELDTKTGPPGGGVARFRSEFDAAI